MQPVYERANSPYATKRLRSILPRLDEETYCLSNDTLRSLDGALAASLLNVRRRINATSPASCLPPEILGKIFTLVPSRSFPSRLETVWPTSYAEPRDLLAITHVCHYWREVALRLQSLWTSSKSEWNYSTRIREPGAIPLLRAGSRPLNVFTSGYSVLGPCGAPPPAPLGERICELVVHAENLLSKSLVKLLDFPAPQLECFILNNAMWPWLEQLDCSKLLLFQDKAPQLRVLELAVIPWIPNNTFTNLTHLCISYSANHNRAMQSRERYLSSLLRLLSHTLALRELFLISIAWTEESFAHDSDVALNYLRRLVLYDMEYATFSKFFAHIRLPLENLAISTTASLGDAREACSLISMLLTPFTSAKPRSRCTQLALQTGPSTGKQSHTLVVASASSAVRMQANWPLAHVAARVCRALDVGAVQELWVSAWTDEAYSDTKAIEGLLRSLHALQTLVLLDGAHGAPAGKLRGWLDALRAEPRVCPLLSTLHLDVGAHALPGAELLAVVQHRGAHGCPVDRLFVEHRPGTDVFGTLDVAVLARCVGCIQVRASGRPPSMEVPRVCTENVPQMYWPDQW